MTSWPDRLVVALGALAGFMGVVLSALAAHVNAAPSLVTAAQFLLAHAPVLLACAALVRAGLLHPRCGRVGAGGIAAGLALFCGDLAVRVLAGVAPLPIAAPTGGVILMAGWALLGLGALVRARG